MSPAAPTFFTFAFALALSLVAAALGLGSAVEGRVHGVARAAAPDAHRVRVRG
eukprot:CAMPEP_0181277294 /NCGR_PEP_ID=MMETSP1097-20121128/11010_1 /TAXON_ID=35684 /ORGANISM="Pseudopedinella elastica, Strain CCMP716" /LENGTH=52 /DNA_ID=CAMNT_0023379085 /DNA_START=8 /DNA_END=163 /DNA_ORIENTATION=+